ncbi:hypothetical protein [Virgibacillus sp. JSM 102003]|uniref:hypothetical protein n=1 Tax=Virgibacillus sp. JSM 102003 TaxID=1562108 RepID=UPI0035BEB860
MKKFGKLIVALAFGVGILALGGNAASADAQTLGIPTNASITSGNDTIQGSSATDYWSISWGGGNGTYFVDFDDDNGGGFYNPSANFTSYSGDSTYYLSPGQTSKTWSQYLRVSSAGGGSDTDGANITQTAY